MKQILFDEMCKERPNGASLGAYSRAIGRGLGKRKASIIASKQSAGSFNAIAKKNIKSSVERSSTINKRIAKVSNFNILQKATYSNARNTIPALGMKRERLLGKLKAQRTRNSYSPFS